MTKKKGAKTTKTVSSFVHVARRSKKQRIIFIIFTVVMAVGLVGSSMMWAFGPDGKEDERAHNSPAMAVSERITGLEDQLKEDPQNANLMAQLAHLYWENGEAEKSVDSYQKALAIKPGNTGWSKNLAQVYYLMGDYDQAVTSLEEALKQNADDIEIYYYLGQFYAYRGDGNQNIEKGIQALEEYVRLQKEGPEVQKVQQMIEILKSGDKE